MTPTTTSHPATTPYPATLRLDRIAMPEVLGPRLLEKVLDHPDFAELNCVSQYLKVQDINPDTGNFTVILMQSPNTPLFFTIEGGNPVIDSVAEEEFVRNPVFYKKFYLDGLCLSQNVTDIFTHAEDVFKAMPEGHLLHFGSEFTHAVRDLFAEGTTRSFNLKMFEGGVPNADIAAMLHSKLAFIRAKFAAKIEKADCSTLSDLAKVKGEYFSPYILQVQMLTDRVSGLNLQKRRSGQDWTRSEVQMELMRPFIRIGCESDKYAEVCEDFFDLTFNTLATGGHVSQTDFYKAIDALENFAYFTAAEDSPDLDHIDYGNRSDPRHAESLRKLNYFAEVQRRIFETFPNTNYSIPYYKQWDGSTRASAAPLDDRDALDPFDVDELSQEMADRLWKKHFKPLLRRYRGIKHSEIRRYFRELTEDHPSSGVSVLDLEARSIADLLPAGSDRRRSSQLDILDDILKKYVRHIFMDRRFWMDADAMLQARIIWQRITH